MPYFVMRPLPERDNNKVVTLIHGLGLRGLSLCYVGRHLTAAGYKVYVYDYFTFLGTIAAHAKRFGAFLEEVERKNPGAEAFHIVSHSLGGIVSRQALSDRPALQVKRLVMLAPPNHGSAMARRLSRLPLLPWLIKPLRELSDAPDAAVHRVGVPPGVEIGVLAAVRGDGKGWKRYMEGDDDGKVALKDTHLAGERDHLTLRASHTLMAFKLLTAREVAAFLAHGHFGRFGR